MRLKSFAMSSSSCSPMLVNVLQNVSELMASGNSNQAINNLLSVQALIREQPLACNTLAYLLLHNDRPREAVTWFDAALVVNPADAQAITGLGMASQAIGDHVRALQCYEAALVWRWNEAAAWYHHGALLTQLGRLREALASLDKAIELQEDYVKAFTKRCQVLSALGDVSGAALSAMRCCQLSPNDVSSWLLFGDLCLKHDDVQHALSAYDRGLEVAPNNFQCLYNKAFALKQVGQAAAALEHVRTALAVEPQNRDALLLCAGLEHDAGNVASAHEYYRRVAAMGVARSYLAAHRPPRFRAMLLFSPLSGNTPYEDLISDACYDADVALVLPDQRVELRAADADIIVNLVSEADLRRDIVAHVAEIVAPLTIPVINHPLQILGTDRQSISQRLAAIPDTVVPATIRVEATALHQFLSSNSLPTFNLIARHAGTHGGDKMELISDLSQLRAFAGEAGDQPLYLTDFFDYRSADGFYRKYRFIFVGEDILPYHLAIGDVWKVHHVSTRMGDVEWMRREEQSFLEQPQDVLGSKAMAALEAIRREIGLDYFGIDCSLDAEGRLVVFEVNASMLIHLHNAGFEYKTPYVLRIKHAFEQLLARRAISVDCR
ncbi:tetratricopeptide repeat protein [Rhizobium sp. 60-20]|uniref:TPR domain-containing protein n=1 Tax=Rhizobium sp. 60-20 TaxID=1895819 RepID=UPI0025F3A70F|nr:tetratricopeptide repeat protein [Rhizobium sp. 60-20]